MRGEVDVLRSAEVAPDQERMRRFACESKITCALNCIRMAVAYEIGSADGASAPRVRRNRLADDHIDASTTAIGAA